jgi:autotransporter passenger strand-loop-strand repeat protein
LRAIPFGCAGGFQYIYSGGTATSAVVNSDGIQEVYGSAVSTIIDDGGNAYIAFGGTGINFVISSGGMLEIADGSALDSNTSLIFAGSGGFLQIDDTTMPTATIYGLGNGDAIGLADVQPGLSPTITLLPNHVL